MSTADYLYICIYLFVIRAAHAFLPSATHLRLHKFSLSIPCCCIFMGIALAVTSHIHIYTLTACLPPIPLIFATALPRSQPLSHSLAHTLAFTSLHSLCGLVGMINNTLGDCLVNLSFKVLENL